MTQTPASGSTKESSALLKEQEIQFICNLAEHCGRLAAEMRATVGVHEKAEPHDLVTDADLALSKLLLKELGTRFPRDFLVSEEEVPEGANLAAYKRIWYIDPIDGTDNYVSGDGQYSVMIGLLKDGKPHFGCVNSPAANCTYYGGPDYGCFVRQSGGSAETLRSNNDAELASPVRLMMGYRDRKANPWVQQLSGVKLVASGSVGLKVAKVINDEADVFVHLSGKLKYWDTVGPIAIGLAAGLEAGTFENDEVAFPLEEFRHAQTLVIGRRGTLAWSRNVIGGRFLK